MDGHPAPAAGGCSRLEFMATESGACAVAHGTSPGPVPATAGPPASAVEGDVVQGSAAGDRTLVAVFASAVSGYLLRYAADAGYRTVLVEPDPARADAARMAGFPVVTAMISTLAGLLADRNARPGGFAFSRRPERVRAVRAFPMPRSHGEARPRPELIPIAAVSDSAEVHYDAEITAT
jgi:hypothetical protein